MTRNSVLVLRSVLSLQAVLSLRSALALLAVLLMAGCDPIESKFADRARDRERADATYRTAMADYAAGRLDAAIAGLEKAVQANPANASARFQLACLYQDQKHDYLPALCHFREFIALDPTSDKVRLAKERYAICERLYAPVLAKKMNLGDVANLSAEVERLKKALADAEQDRERLKKELDGEMKTTASLRRETDNLRRQVTSIGDIGETKRPDFSDAKALLEDDADEGVDKAKLAQDVKKLAEEEAAEQAATPFAPLPQKKEEPAKPAAIGPTHPPTYVVQEGDTLIKIAQRFYGHKSAWRKIQEANKAIVSSDGRVKVGQTLKLP